MLLEGVALDSDDLLRREVIKQLICNFKLDETMIESEFSVSFNRYFKRDLGLLQTFINDELVEVDDKIVATLWSIWWFVISACVSINTYDALASNGFSRYLIARLWLIKRSIMRRFFICAVLL